jgi:hypothetical protein
MKDNSVSYKRLGVIEKRVLDVLMNDKIAPQEITTISRISNVRVFEVKVALQLLAYKKLIPDGKNNEPTQIAKNLTEE